MKLIYVLIPLPLCSGAYVYELPNKLASPEYGSFVQVPFGKRTLLGVVWHKTDTKIIAKNKIKQITKIYNRAPLSEDLISLIKFISAYTLSELGSVLKLILPLDKIITNPTKITYLSLNQSLLNKLTEKGLNEKGSLIKITQPRQKIIDFFQSCNLASTSGGEVEIQKITASMLALKTKSSRSVINSLIKAGLIKQSSELKVQIAQKLLSSRQVKLSSEQAKASVRIIAELGKFRPILLDGITGSGKTEVYFEVIEKAVSMGMQVLVLLPEISLSSQWRQRFKDRFSIFPNVWHSEVSNSKKQDTWLGVASGCVKVVVGARSALHLNYKNLGLIIIDEEHDNSYKQADGVLYNARDMAIFRAKCAKCPVVLASATPSIETWANAKSGKFLHLKLAKRFGKQKMAKISLLNLTEDKPAPDKFICEELHKNILATFKAGKQSLLFLNRRGYAPLTLCRSCGYRFECNNCKSWLVSHKPMRNGMSEDLLCHHCGYRVCLPDCCPDCGDSENLSSCGPGVERIHDEIKSSYPSASIFVATSETLSNEAATVDFIDKVESGKIDIIIGTQIVAKGYDFPNLTLIGVIDGDMTLTGGDLRAGEQTFQILHQVSGRAGRGSAKGLSFIQTANPQHPILKALSDNKRDSFLDLELGLRKASCQPPFFRLVAIIISNTSQSKCHLSAKLLRATSPNLNSDGRFIETLGPAEPHMPYLRGRHRIRLLVRSTKNINIQKVIFNWINSTASVPRTSKIQIDVDPYNFF